MNSSIRQRKTCYNCLVYKFDAKITTYTGGPNYQFDSKIRVVCDKCWKTRYNKWLWIRR